MSEPRGGSGVSIDAEGRTATDDVKESSIEVRARTKVGGWKDETVNLPEQSQIVCGNACSFARQEFARQRNNHNKKTKHDCCYDCSSPIPTSLWPQIFSRLSASGRESIMFQIIKEKCDVLIESR